MERTKENQPSMTSCNYPARKLDNIFNLVSLQTNIECEDLIDLVVEYLDDRNYFCEGCESSTSAEPLVCKVCKKGICRDCEYIIRHHYGNSENQKEKTMCKMCFQTINLSFGCNCNPKEKEKSTELDIYECEECKKNMNNKESNLEYCSQCSSQCEECDRIYCDEDHSKKCEHCNKTYCNQCAEKNTINCHQCEKFICYYCYKQCKFCKEYYCEKECIRECFNCNRDYCVKCEKEHDCWY